MEYRIDECYELQVQKEQFLSNEKNKDNLIKLLMRKFQENNILCQQANADADLDIVKTAITTGNFPGKNIAIFKQKSSC